MNVDYIVYRIDCLNSKETYDFVLFGNTVSARKIKGKYTITINNKKHKNIDRKTLATLLTEVLG